METIRGRALERREDRHSEVRKKTEIVADTQSKTGRLE